MYLCFALFNFCISVCDVRDMFVKPNNFVSSLVVIGVKSQKPGCMYF